MERKEIVVFGGSFDPPTVVHLQIIRSLLGMREFDEVWVMPSGERADKPHTTRVAKRLEMLATLRDEVFGGDERLKISGFEAGLAQPTETYNTVQALNDAFPGMRFSFVFGADSIGTMHEWHKCDYLLENLPIIAVPRHGYVIPPTAHHVSELPDLEIFEKGISSTEVRRRVSTGDPLKGLVCKEIERFIEQHRLYQSV